MSGNDALAAPWNDLLRFGASGPKSLLPRHSTRLWSWRRRVFAATLPRIATVSARACDRALPPVDPAWVAAILWDELARRDMTEAATDWVLGRLGRDPSVGLFQVTGRTAQDVIQFLCTAPQTPGAWASSWISADAAELRYHLLNVDFAIRIVTGRFQQILAHWQGAGHHPMQVDGLGQHRLSPIQLIGTLYSQGLGVPKPNPETNGRGAQIARFAQQVRTFAAENGVVELR